ncbi:hypothetical protein [Streptomyces sp. SID5643]|uniref:hypothetical protein n=1 Tax=Streptomyces sp. SID5643 TaxID=2690307 RepID=UPI00136909B0|nr:hypothetical protein [Streptomyces sp. SID5643]MZF90683.1 hypothetical protein [Streptomyces sp. SID5643]
MTRSQPHRYESQPVRGDLSRLDVGTVELRDGTSTVRAGQGQGRTCTRVPAGGRAGGRAGVNFTILAGSSLPRRIDRRPAFGATADDHAEVPATVALIHRG